MTYIRAALITACLLLVCLLVFIYFKFDNSYKLEVAAKIFQKGEYNDADFLLNKLKSSLSPAQFHLYKAYIARGQRELKDSNHQLSLALTDSMESKDKVLIEEIYINQAINDYLSNDIRNLDTSIDLIAKTFKDSDEWLTFFSGIKNLMMHNCKDALNQINKTPKVFLSTWMKKGFENIFSPFWLTTQMAKCNIEVGNYLSVRQNLENEILKAIPEDLDPINFLLGLSYSKESENKSPGAALPYQRLAFSYYDRIPQESSTYSQEREGILNSVENQIQEIIKTKSFQDLSFYTEVLEKWNAIPQLNAVSAKLDAILNQAIETNSIVTIQEVSVILSQVLPQGKLRQHLNTRFQELVQNALEKKEFERLTLYWNAAQLFAPNPEQYTNQVSYQLVSVILRGIGSDDNNLSQTGQYLTFWKNIQKSPNKRFELANELVKSAFTLWDKNRQPEKSIHLMVLAKALPDLTDQKTLQTEIEQQVNQIYLANIHNNDINGLSEVLKAINELNLKNINIYDKKQIAQQIGEAQTLFKSNHYPEAYNKSRWVLMLEPKNPDAKQIIGMINFYNGNYLQAYNNLKSLNLLGPEQNKALVISKILSEDSPKSEEELNTLPKGSLTPDDFFRLGFGFILKDKSDEAILWLQKINPPNPPVYAGLAYANFQKKSWKIALENFQKLTPPYNNLPGIQEIAIQSLVNTGNVSKADEMIQNLIKENIEPKDQFHYPQPFEAFKKRKLDPLNKNYIIGLYTQNTKKNPELALKYFEKIVNPSPEALLKKGEILISLNRFEDAKKNFYEALNLLKGENSDLSTIKNIYLLLGECHTSLGEYIEATFDYKRYYELDPHDMLHRQNYAQPLMRIKRFDLALSQYKALDPNKLSPEERLGYITCLIHTNAFEAADKIAKNWLEQDPKPSLPLQLQLGQLLFITRNAELIKNILSHIPEPTKRNFQENLQLLDFFIFTGEYESAKIIIKDHLNELEKNVNGLMSIAHLSWALSHQKKALDIAGKAAKMDPLARSPDEFLVKHDHSLKFLESSIENNKAKLKEDPNSLTWQINYARDLMELVVAKQIDDKNSLHNAPELYKAHDILDKLANSNNDIPQIFFLLGKVLLLLESSIGPDLAFTSAIKLDTSYVDAYKSLGNLYIQTKNYNEAMVAILMAVRFAPNDSEAWNLLGDLNDAQGEVIDAVTAFQNSMKYRPNQAEAYIKLGKLNISLKNPEDAIETLEKGLILDPNNVQALEFLLIATYDPNLSLGAMSSSEILEKQNNTYLKLHTLEPQKAEKLLNEIKQKRTDGSWEWP